MLLTVAVTGGVLTLFSRGGFVGVPGLPRHQRYRLSLLMLAVSLAGAVWACWAPDNSILPVVATLTLLIGGRRFLIAGLPQKSANGIVLVPVLAGASDTTEDYT
ncbi:hypothetical protein V1T76_24505 [Roseibium sp. FZY0029]|uniref:hypothetical protein n=1 Tax=Roseibium sp. FZY0029 TaxID=3116647 RepID=UPI002EA21850|nr:hypothetical protein [Roseibium sp. FZY0029]